MLFWVGVSFGIIGLAILWDFSPKLVIGGFFLWLSYSSLAFLVEKIQSRDSQSGKSKNEQTEG